MRITTIIRTPRHDPHLNMSLTFARFDKTLTTGGAPCRLGSFLR